MDLKIRIAFLYGRFGDVCMPPVFAARTRQVTCSRTLKPMNDSWATIVMCSAVMKRSTFAVCDLAGSFRG
jgi:hypothetical protein